MRGEIINQPERFTNPAGQKNKSNIIIFPQTEQVAESDNMPIPIRRRENDPILVEYRNSIFNKIVYSDRTKSSMYLHDEYPTQAFVNIESSGNGILPISNQQLNKNVYSVFERLGFNIDDIEKGKEEAEKSPDTEFDIYLTSDKLKNIRLAGSCFSYNNSLACIEWRVQALEQMRGVSRINKILPFLRRSI